MSTPLLTILCLYICVLSANDRSVSKRQPPFFVILCPFCWRARQDTGSTEQCCRLENSKRQHPFLMMLCPFCWRARQDTGWLIGNPPHHKVYEKVILHGYRKFEDRPLLHASCYTLPGWRLVLVFIGARVYSKNPAQAHVRDRTQHRTDTFATFARSPLPR